MPDRSSWSWRWSRLRKKLEAGLRVRKLVRKLEARGWKLEKEWVVVDRMYSLPNIELPRTSLDTSFENDKRASRFGVGKNNREANNSYISDLHIHLALDELSILGGGRASHWHPGGID